MCHHQKGVYFDGHKTDDVSYRSDFLLKLNELDKKSLTRDGVVPQLHEGENLLEWYTMRVYITLIVMKPFLGR